MNICDFSLILFQIIDCRVTLGCGHIGVDYSGIRCTFLRGTRILEIKHYDFLIPGRIGGDYSKSSYRRV